ncbi:MAG: hypothetical protein OXI79_13180 [Gammaproteobacteria bacterium]|nr:hypothetical protein [Gammaproteobacteria bacterium]
MGKSKSQRQRNGAPVAATSAYRYSQSYQNSRRTRNSEKPTRKSRRYVYAATPSRQERTDQPEMPVSSDRNHNELPQRVPQVGASLSPAARKRVLASVLGYSEGFFIGASIGITNPTLAEQILYRYIFGLSDSSVLWAARAPGKPFTVKDSITLIAGLNGIVALIILRSKVLMWYKRYLVEETKSALKRRTGKLLSSMTIDAKFHGTGHIRISDNFPATQYLSIKRGPGGIPISIKRGQYAYVLNASAPQGKKRPRNYILRSRLRVRGRMRKAVRVTWHRLR